MTTENFTAIALVIGLALAVSLPCAADDSSLDDLRARIAELERQVTAIKAGSPGAEAGKLAELERQIQVLAQEIENLRIGEAASPAADEGRHGMGPAAAKVYGIKRGVSIGGYGEMLYQNFSSSREDGQPSGASDQLDFLRAVLYFGYKFNDRIVFNSEIEIEHATTGEGEEERGEVAVEFAYLDFLVRPAFNVRAGMVLMPVGFVNEMHEPPVFLGARRPLVERVIVPATWSENGVGVFGDAGPLTYRAYLVTGLAAVAGTSSGADGFGPGGIRDGRSSGSNSAAKDLAVVGRVDGRPLSGLLVGASLYSGKAGQGAISPATGRRIDARTTLAEGHAEYRRRGLQARVLYARSSIGDAAAIDDAQGLTGAASVGERQYGWYAEVGYDVLAGHEGTKHAFIPFVRHERFDTQDRVPAGFASDPANDADVTTVGAAWKPIPNVAVKFDWSRQSDRARTGVDQVSVSLGYLF